MLIFLSGCGSLLERDYLRISTYQAVSAAEDNSSALRAESYQELVNAILYLIEQGVENGVIDLYNYTGDVGDDLAKACQEATQEDPYGAYVVEYIKQEYALLVTYYEVKLTITYRRTPEEIAQIVSVTGRSAIRQQFAKALTGFSDHMVLYLNYFDGDASDLQELALEAYYSAPAYAQGLPEMTFSFYPDNGTQRIVDITLTYGVNADSPLQYSQQVQNLAQSVVEQAEEENGQEPITPEILFVLLRDRMQQEEGSETQEEQSTAWAALTGQLANSEGTALAYQLLCDQAGLDCTIVRGSLWGENHFWNIVTEYGVSRHLDLSEDLFSLTDDELTNVMPYDWDRSDYPACMEEEA